MSDPSSVKKAAKAAPSFALYAAATLSWKATTLFSGEPIIFAVMCVGVVGG